MRLFARKPRRDGHRTRTAAARAVEVMESRLHPDFRQAMWTGALALITLIVGSQFGGLHAHGTRRPAAIALAVGFAGFGVIAVRSAAGEAARVAGLRGGAGTAAAIRIGVAVAGYLVILLATLNLLDISIHQVLLGGAITGVVVGIAAQQSLGNLAAGIVMLISRPFTVGEFVRIRSGALNGPFDGTITSIGLVYTSIDTEEGPLAIPNSALLGSAVGRLRDPATAEILRPRAGSRAGGAARDVGGRHTLIW